VFSFLTVHFYARGPSDPSRARIYAPRRHPGCLAPLPVSAIPQTDHRDRPRPRAKKQALKVLTRNIDTGTPEGRLFFHITAAFDEFQRELIVENTKAGLSAARKRGRKGGRPRAMDKEKTRAAEAMLKDTVNYPFIGDVIDHLRIGRTAFYRYFPPDRIRELRNQP